MHKPEKKTANTTRQKLPFSGVPELSGTFTPMRISSDGGLLNFGN
jgi:hypothetical protein